MKADKDKDKGPKLGEGLLEPLPPGEYWAIPKGHELVIERPDKKKSSPSDSALDSGRGKGG